MDVRLNEFGSAFVRVMAVLIYLLAFHYGYFNYSYKIFEYAGFDYVENSFIEYGLAYALALSPVVFLKKYDGISYYGIVMIFLFVYSPAQLMFQFNIADMEERVIIQLTLVASFFTLLYISKIIDYKHSRRFRLIDSRLLGFIVIFSFIITIYLFYKFASYMRFVSFHEVYELRLETNKIEIHLIFSYGLMWMTYLFIPVIVAYGYVKNNWYYIILGLFFSITIYLVNGSKLAILLIFIIYTLLFLFKIRGDFLSNLAFAIGIFLVVIFMIPDSEVTMWAKSILINRIIATPGWTLVHYYEYFTAYGFSFYGHINVINLFFDNYPYGDLSLGQLIGLEYSGTTDANFNANFWSSDGIAALGIFGLLMVSIFVGVFFNFLDIVSRKFDMQFLFISTVGFWQAVINLPFSVALFSGGGLLFIMLLLISKIKFKGVV